LYSCQQPRLVETFAHHPSGETAGCAPGGASMRVHVAAEIADSRLLRRAWAFSLSQSGCARALTVSVDIVQGLATCGRASAHLHSCQHGTCCEFIRAARIVRIDSIPCRAGSRNQNTSRTLVLSRGNALATRLVVLTMAMRSSAGPCRQSRAWGHPVPLSDGC
jgi:hypothetical protein